MSLRADSGLGAQPEDRGAPETSGRERDAAHPLHPEADDGEGTDEEHDGDRRAGEVHKRSLLAAASRRARAGQAEPLRNHQTRIASRKHAARYGTCTVELYNSTDKDLIDISQPFTMLSRVIPIV